MTDDKPDETRFDLPKDPQHRTLIRALDDKADEILKRQPPGTVVVERFVMSSWDNAAWMVIRLSTGRVVLIHGFHNLGDLGTDVYPYDGDQGVIVEAVPLDGRILPLVMSLAANAEAARTFCSECGHHLEVVRAKRKMPDPRGLMMLGPQGRHEHKGSPLYVRATICRGCGIADRDPDVWLFESE